MAKVKVGAIPSNLLLNPVIYATFPITDLNRLLAIAGCQGIRFFSANTSIDGVSYLSVMAVGIDSTGNNLTDFVLLDTEPCPPECHYAGVAGNPNDDIRAISLADAQSRIATQPFSFSAFFDRTDDLEVMFTLPDAFKLRVFFALLPNRDAPNAQPTFVVQAAYQNGDALLNVYLQDDAPANSGLL